MKIRCHHCNKSNKVPEEYIGKTVHCAVCLRPFVPKKEDVVHSVRPPDPTPQQTQNLSGDPIIWPIVIGIILTVIFAILLDTYSAPFYGYSETILQQQLIAIEYLNSAISVVGGVCIAFGLLITCLLTVICRELKRINAR